MKIKHSLKGQIERDINSKLVKRKGKLLIINKFKPKLKVKQKNSSLKRKLRLR